MSEKNQMTMNIYSKSNESNWTIQTLNNKTIGKTKAGQ